ncbi:DNA ligase [Synechococcus phage BUCT-ZZ01]|nr:DNA ligase [Synechococcus phage BUCT-ZZ01]
MKTVYSILKELEATSSGNEKKRILEENKDNELLKRFFNLALNPHIQFYIRKIPACTKSVDQITLEEAMNRLSDLSSRKYTGNAAIAHLSGILSSTTEEDADVIKRIIGKDPDCGVQGTTVNKFWKKLIPVYPCLLAAAYDAPLARSYDWASGVFGQLKSDGMRVNIIIDNEANVEVRSRNGKLVDCLGVFDNLKDTYRGQVLDGELLVMGDDGKPLDRKTGNGIGNKAVKGTLSYIEAESLFINVWDIIPYDSFIKEKDTTPYKDRFAKLEALVQSNPYPNVRLIPSQILYSLKDARQLYKDYVSAGEEGILIKQQHMIWEADRSKDQMKFKEEIECELRMKGFNFGTEGSRNENRVGSLIAESECGMVKVNVSGISDEEREELMKPEYIDKVITVKFNQLINTRDNQFVYSMFLPRLVEVRHDKDKADTLEEIRNIIRAKLEQ